MPGLAKWFSNLSFWVGVGITFVYFLVHILSCDFFSLSKAWTEKWLHRTDKCEWASWGWMESWEKLRWILGIPTAPWRSHGQPSFIHSAFSPWMEHKKLGLMTKTFSFIPHSWSHFNSIFFFELDSETTNFICIQKDQVSIVSRILRMLELERKKWQWRSFYKWYIISASHALLYFIIILQVLYKKCYRAALLNF